MINAQCKDQTKLEGAAPLMNVKIVSVPPEQVKMSGENVRFLTYQMGP